MDRSIQFRNFLYRLTIATLICGFPYLSSADNKVRPHEFDVVVYGGTAGGVAAAVQASRMGKTVALIEPGEHIGGLTSGGLGATDIGNKAAIGGVSREFYRRIKKHYNDESAWKWERSTEYKSPRQNAPQGDTLAGRLNRASPKLCWSKCLSMPMCPFFARSVWTDQLA